MTTINESQTAKGYTPAASVPQVFGRARTIDGIVIHHWGLTGQTHDGVVNFFVNGPGQTSAHFVVSAGRIDCIVSPLDAAWHSGNAVGNATTIGIECRPEATDADYATVAELVAWLRSEYGNLPLTPHRQWQSTACPGVWNLDRINALAAAAPITPKSSTSTPKEDTLSAAEVQEIKEYVHALIVGGYKSAGKDKPGIADAIEALPNKVWETTVLRGGEKYSVKTELVRTRTEVQALRAAVAALAKNPSLTADQITEAVKAGLAEANANDAAA
jgi:hypothetical protein